MTAHLGDKSKTASHFVSLLYNEISAGTSRVHSIWLLNIIDNAKQLYIRTHTPNSKSLERAWSRGIVDKTKEYSFVLSTMPWLHARSRLLEIGVYRGNVSNSIVLRGLSHKFSRSHCYIILSSYIWPTFRPTIYAFTESTKPSWFWNAAKSFQSRIAHVALSSTFCCQVAIGMPGDSKRPQGRERVIWERIGRGRLSKKNISFGGRVSLGLSEPINVKGRELAL